MMYDLGLLQQLLAQREWANDVSVGSPFINGDGVDATIRQSQENGDDEEDGE